VPQFVPGLSLAAATYEVVRPILDDAFPGVAYSAALMGPGSEVLGFDTPRSTDHDWGPRLQLFVSPEDRRDHGAAISRVLAERLPATVLGWPTNSERIVVADLDSWLPAVLGLDPRPTPTARDWVSLPTQLLREVTAGVVFHDGLNQLAPMRETLKFYPEDIWRYVLACQWRRIAQEEPFPGRCAEVGDELGSRMLTGRLVRDMMRLALLLHREYPPYGKWLGTAVSRLRADDLQALLTRALDAKEWPAREEALCGAAEYLGRAHNALGLTDYVEPTVRLFFDRPFRVLDADRFGTALRGSITDPAVLALPPHLGSVDQFVDSTDVLSAADRAVTAARAFQRNDSTVES
jgi:hypothetical protein